MDAVQCTFKLHIFLSKPVCPFSICCFCLCGHQQQQTIHHRPEKYRFTAAPFHSLASLQFSPDQIVKNRTFFSCMKENLESVICQFVAENNTNKNSRRSNRSDRKIAAKMKQNKTPNRINSSTSRSRLMCSADIMTVWRYVTEQSPCSEAKPTKKKNDDGKLRLPRCASEKCDIFSYPVFWFLVAGCVYSKGVYCVWRDDNRTFTAGGVWQHIAKLQCAPNKKIALTKSKIRDYKAKNRRDDVCLVSVCRVEHTLTLHQCTVIWFSFIPVTQTWYATFRVCAFCHMHKLHTFIDGHIAWCRNLGQHRVTTFFFSFILLSSVVAAGNVHCTMQTQMQPFDYANEKTLFSFIRATVFFLHCFTLFIRWDDVNSEIVQCS